MYRTIDGQHLLTVVRSEHPLQIRITQRHRRTASHPLLGYGGFRHHRQGIVILSITIEHFLPQIPGFAEGSRSTTLTLPHSGTFTVLRRNPDSLASASGLRSFCMMTHPLIRRLRSLSRCIQQTSHSVLSLPNRSPRRYIPRISGLPHLAY